MKKLIATLLLITLIPSIGYCRDPWTTKDTIRHSVFTGLMVLDWQQTKEISRNPEWREFNPIIGNDAEQWWVDTYFAVSYVAVTAACYYAPKKWRKIIQMVMITVEASCVSNNAAIGVKIRW